MSATPTRLQQLAAQEVLRQEAALESLGAFREYMTTTGSLDFEHLPARHHLLIMDKLQQLERGQIQRLMILSPPGSAKSTYCSIQYPLWRLARRPGTNILCASNTEGLAENFNRRRRNIALTPQWCRLADTKLASDQQGAGHFATEKGGGIRAAGVGSAIVGFRSHLNILDDPIRNLEEALSPTALDKQFDWFMSDFRSRLVPGAPELIVSTRWARKDIAGRILELVKEGREEWTVLRLPMVADSDDDPLGRPQGESLWPEWFGPAYIAEKQQNVFNWSTQYQQTPLDAAGSWIGQECIQYADGVPLGEPYRVIAIDLALTVGRGDWTVFIVGQLDENRRLHVVDIRRARVGPDESVDMLFELFERYSPHDVLIDDDNASKVFRMAAHERARSLSRPFALHAIPMRGKDKETRAAAIRAMFLRGDVRLVRAPWNVVLVKELLEFPSGDHDDCVDALGLIGRRYPYLPSPAREKPPAPSIAPQTRMAYDEGSGRYVLNSNLTEMFKDNERRMRADRKRI
jgi:predicted phage terminase large subunit-like protein